jgi:hypothetical protein
MGFGALFFGKRPDAVQMARELLGHESSKARETYAQRAKKGWGKLRSTIADRYIRKKRKKT